MIPALVIAVLALCFIVADANYEILTEVHRISRSKGTKRVPMPRNSAANVPFWAVLESCDNNPIVPVKGALSMGTINQECLSSTDGSANVICSDKDVTYNLYSDSSCKVLVNSTSVPMHSCSDEFGFSASCSNGQEIPINSNGIIAMGYLDSSCSTVAASFLFVEDNICISMEGLCQEPLISQYCNNYVSSLYGTLSCNSKGVPAITVTPACSSPIVFGTMPIPTTCQSTSAVDNSLEMSGSMLASCYPSIPPAPSTVLAFNVTQVLTDCTYSKYDPPGPLYSAITSAVAMAMKGVTPSMVTINGLAPTTVPVVISASLGSSTNHMRSGHASVESNTASAIMVNYTVTTVYSQLGYTSSYAAYQSLTSQLKTSIETTAFDSNLQTMAATYNATALLTATSQQVDITTASPQDTSISSAGSGSSGNSDGAIIGGVVGAFAGVGLIGAVWYYGFGKGAMMGSGGSASKGDDVVMVTSSNPALSNANKI